MADRVTRPLVRRPSPAARPAQQTEAEFQAAVVALAKLSGWTHLFHAYDSRKSTGTGFPDWCMVRHPRVIFAELKRDPSEKPTKEQLDWLDELSQCPGVEVYLWTPADIDEIRRTLAPDWAARARQGTG